MPLLQLALLLTQPSPAETVRIDGAVVTLIEDSDVSAQESGKIEQFDLQRGDIVERDAVLGILNSEIDEVITTDSTPGASEDKVTRVPVGGLLGEAIRRIHRNESVSYLFD